jgi:hypothetical protein
MKTHTLRLILVALLAFPVAAMVVAEEPKAKPAPAVTFQGRIDSVDVDGRRLTLSDVTMIANKQRETIGSVTFTVSDFARIWLDGREAQLRDLREGFSVRVEARLGNTPDVRGVDLIEARSR